ncbi:unnamed protein product [Ambrosiozyma monospora]|uniref:Unnamed protein product n=1 Tax=Ambrosiozyma monospora TaxID=43982 RepID=A0ACB5SSB9_AMBMO|nr:unnamed protein product [Ambrosiozyma monospora]
MSISIPISWPLCNTQLSTLSSCSMLILSPHSLLAPQYITTQEAETLSPYDHKDVLSKLLKNPNESIILLERYLQKTVKEIIDFLETRFRSASCYFIESLSAPVYHESQKGNSRVTDGTEDKFKQIINE